MEKVIEVEGLGFSYGDEVLLSDLSFDVAAGEAVVLLGPSGSGKTTLLRLLSGLAEPQKGGVRVPEDEEGQAGVRTVFQAPRLFPWLNVRGNLEFALRSADVHKENWESRISGFLGKVGMEGTEDLQVKALSGGMAQRIALVRALCCLPRVLLLDEPFSALDPRLRRILQDDLIALLGNTEVAVVMVTHDIDEAVKIGDSVLVLRDAAIAMRVRPAEIGAAAAVERLSECMGE
jgi:ABC-type nitrate/sulfonate/bicarbonate transport system ATPase subunit